MVFCRAAMAQPSVALPWQVQAGKPGKLRAGRSSINVGSCSTLVFTNKSAPIPTLLSSKKRLNLSRACLQVSWKAARKLQGSTIVSFEIGQEACLRVLRTKVLCKAAYCQPASCVQMFDSLTCQKLLKKTCLLKPPCTLA